MSDTPKEVQLWFPGFEPDPPVVLQVYIKFE